MKKIMGLTLLLLTGCSTLQVATSIPEDELKDSVFNYYDKESNVMYQVSNNEKNLHIKLKTSDQSSAMKILRQGLHIYFDTNGKKKKDVFLQYPIADQDRMHRPSGNNQASGQRIKSDLAVSLEGILKEALFSNNGDTEFILLNLITSDIEPSISLSEESELNYDLIIPFHRISENGLAGLSTLSIGIVGGSMEMQGNEGGRAEGMHQGGGRQGGKGSGGGRSGGGRSGGGRSGGGRSGGGQVGMYKGAMSSHIEIWFQVELHTKENHLEP